MHSKTIMANMMDVRHANMDDDNVTTWTVDVSASDCPDGLRKALLASREHTLRLRIVFPDDFPICPPFLYVHTPQFAPMTGHVLRGGAICSELLSSGDSPSAWRPTIRMKAVIDTVLHTMADGKPVVVRSSPGTESTARDSFNRAAVRYGWKTD